MTISRKNTLRVLIVILALLSVFWLLRTKNTLLENPVKLAAQKTALSQPESPIATADWRQVLQQPPHGAREAEKWEWWREMGRRDPTFQFKMPISFFGKVIDDGGNPVSGATVNLSWTSATREGTSAKILISDAEGMFSLLGERGGGLLVQVTKQGYTQSLTRNRFSFEYANFSDAKYHEPDRKKPVVFVLRKNREADPLIVRENQEAQIAPGQSKSFPIGPNATILVERLPNVTDDPHGWAARVSVKSGGLALATGEFPFEAPEDGYTDSVEITNKTPKPEIWMGDNGTAFFVKTQQSFARVTVSNTPGMSWVYVSSFFNPKPGSRNLEFDPAKVIKPTQ